MYINIYNIKVDKGNHQGLVMASSKSGPLSSVLVPWQGLKNRENWTENTEKSTRYCNDLWFME